MKAVAVRPGDLVVFMVRRLGTSVNDRMGLLDMTTDDTCCDRGRSLRHGFLRERVVDDVDFASKRLESVREVGVLLEPLSVAAKANRQAYEIQRRLGVWRPRRAIVLGAELPGLLAAMARRTCSALLIT